MKHLYQPLFARSNPEIETVTAKRGEVVKFLPARRNPAPTEVPPGIDGNYLDSWGFWNPEEQNIIWLVDFAVNEVPANESISAAEWLALEREARVNYFNNRASAVGGLNSDLNDYFENTDDPRVESTLEDDPEVETDDEVEGGQSFPEDDFDFTEDTPYYFEPVLYKGPQSWSNLTDDQQYLIYYIDFAEHHQAPEGMDSSMWATMTRQERIASSADAIADDAILNEYFEDASVTDYQSVDLIGEVDVITRDYINAVTSGAADLEADSLQFIVGMVLNLVLDLKENEVFAGIREDLLDRYLIERLPNALHLFLFTAFPAYTPQQLIDCFAIALEAEDTQDELDFVEAEASALCSQSNLDNTPSNLQANFAAFCDKASNSSETKQAYYNNVFPWEDGLTRAGLIEGTAVVNTLVSGLGELNADEVSELMDNLVIDDSPIQDIAAASNKKKPMQLGTKIGLGLTAVLLGRGIYVAYKYSQGESVNYFGTLLDSRGPTRPTPVFDT
jgi:hypothetical protein